MSIKTTFLTPFGVMIEPLSSEMSVSSIPLEQINQLFYTHQLVVLRGFQTFETAHQFSDYCESHGEIALWPFGKVLELIEHDHPEDHIFDHSSVPLHWDGMYRPQVPEKQIFHCVYAPQEHTGGRTTFSNTKLVLENTSPDLINLWNQVEGVYQRKMEFYNSKTIAPLITKHPQQDYWVIRYCGLPKQDEAFINHPDITLSKPAQLSETEIHQQLEQALSSSSCFYAHSWETGDVVIADNFTLLHGRESYQSGNKRHLRRVHVLPQTTLPNPHLVSHV
jgi:L-tyrosine isonitrile desaturase/decarboxylase